MLGLMNNGVSEAGAPSHSPRAPASRPQRQRERPVGIPTPATVGAPSWSAVGEGASAPERPQAGMEQGLGSALCSAPSR